MKMKFQMNLKKFILFGIFLTLLTGCGKLTLRTPEANNKIQPTQQVEALPPKETPIASAEIPTQIQPTPLGGGSGRIAFSLYSIDMRNSDLFVMNISDNGNIIQLTKNDNVIEILWSPDGEKIAFVNKFEGNYDIYVINADGNNKLRLTSNSGTNLLGLWSLDGRKIYFSSNRTGKTKIYSMNVDGSSQKLIANTNQEKDSCHGFSLSSSGKIIVYSSDYDGYCQICLMNTDGTNKTILTQNKSNNYDPKFSPDEKMISFISNRDGHKQIYVMNSDGNNQRRLSNTDSFIDDVGAIWISEIKSIGVYSENNQSSHLMPPCFINVENENRNCLNEIDSGDEGFLISPDNKKMIRIININGNSRIYLMDIDGNNQEILTDQTGLIADMRWSPA